MTSNSIFYPEFQQKLNLIVGIKDITRPIPVPEPYVKPHILQLIEKHEFESIQELLTSDTIERCSDSKGKSLTDYLVMNYKMAPNLKAVAIRAAAWRARRYAVMARAVLLDNMDRL